MEDLLNWVNQFYEIKSLNELKHTPTLVLFIEKIFKIPIIKKDLNSILNRITFNTQIHIDNSQEPVVLLDFIRSQYQYYIMHHQILNNQHLSFTAYIYLSFDNNLNNSLITWLNHIFSDYINASFILPVQNLTNTSHWKNGHYLLCMLHYHVPSVLSNLNTHLLQPNVLSTFNDSFNQAFHTYPVFISSLTTLSDTIQLLLDFIPYLKLPNKDETLLRHQHMTYFQSIPSPVSATPSLSDKDHPTTFTYTTQHVRWTKTTKYSTTVSPHSVAHILHQLELVVPTRSSNNYSDVDTVIDDDVRVLHPLQASEEDYVTYDRTFHQLQHDSEALIEEDETLKAEFEQAERCFETFKWGFEFARACKGVRDDLDGVQQQMVKSMTTQAEIQDLEQCMRATQARLASIRCVFASLMMDDTYTAYLQTTKDQFQLVQSWVDEVRVWFGEAERIKHWIDIRIGQLTEIPKDGVSPKEIAQLHETLAHLESEIDQFDAEDMARLRSHVKTLTGSDQAMSPADTTTIEITLTTLTTLDHLMHALRKNKRDVHVLQQRTVWEEQLAQCLTWLQQIKVQVDSFLMSRARWTPNCEKNQPVVVQELLTLERHISEFDADLFTCTVEVFQDLVDSSQQPLPEQFELCQSEMEQLFEDVMNRMTFARKVVEQRLSVRDFLHQADMAYQDMLVLQMDLVDARPSNNNDRELTTRIKHTHDIVVKLLTTQIPYPVPDLEKDIHHKSNEVILQVVTDKQNELIQLSKALDRHLHTFHTMLQLNARAQEYLRDADKLTDWADDRVNTMKRARTNLLENTAQDHTSDYKRILNKLKSEKENQVVDLLTRVHLLIETIQKLKMHSIDQTRLRQASDHLQSRFDRLQQMLEDYGRLLDESQQKLKRDTIREEQTHTVRAFIRETRRMLPSLKQTCGFMTGDSRDQDQKKLDQLTQTLHSIKQQIHDQQAVYQKLPQQPDLDLEWEQLKQDMQDMENFHEIVGQWYARQRRLSTIESELNHKSIDSSIKVLEETGLDITCALNSQDPLQVANYSCARDRHLALTHKAQAMKDQSTREAESLKALEEFKRQVQDQIDAVNRRVSGLGGFASSSMESMNDLFHRIQEANQVSEKSLARLTQALDQLNSPESAKDKLNLLFDMIQLEKKQAVFVRKVYVHAKAAHDLQTWIDDCSSTISELWTVDDSDFVQQELVFINGKMIEMKPTIQTFEAMEPRIFATTVLVEIRLNEDQIRQAMKERKAVVFKRWQDLQNNHRGLSRQQNINQFMAQIKVMKDRVDAVQVCRQTQIDDAFGYRDSNTILKRPLTSAYRLSSAKSELDILEHGIQELEKKEEHGITHAAVNGLMELVQTKKNTIAKAEKMERFLAIMDEIEVLLLALSEVLSSQRQADLNSFSVDLDARYRYYEPKINALFEDAKQVASMENPCVVESLHRLTKKWKKLQRDVDAMKSSLLKLVGPISLDAMEDGILKEKARKVVQPIIELQTPPPTPKPMPRFNSVTTPKPRHVPKTVHPRQFVAESPVQKKINQQQQEQQQPVIMPYVADPKNDLDVAVGNIVNESPFKVQVKMVPGEVGKYWFGHVNPKLAYCRILPSRMVMVRVGGGWVELSQFLRDHALLQDTPKKSARLSLPPPASGKTVQDAFLNVGSTSNSTPTSAPLTHGIKSGDKFLVAVDNKGNQVEVKMTKAKSKTTKFITPRRNL